MAILLLTWLCVSIFFGAFFIAEYLPGDSWNGLRYQISISIIIMVTACFFCSGGKITGFPLICMLSALFSLSIGNILSMFAEYGKSIKCKY